MTRSPASPDGTHLVYCFAGAHVSLGFLTIPSPGSRVLPLLPRAGVGWGARVFLLSKPGVPCPATLPSRGLGPSPWLQVVQ